MPASPSPSSDPAWGDYWKADRLASCVPESPRAEADIAAFWQGVFATLPAGSAILDIATGNGAVLAEAGRAARRSGKHFERTGVDLADIDPHRFVSDPTGDLAGVRFHGGVAAESLPFESESFDCVVSQYGLEYAELTPALAEVARVLRPGGRLRWLAHSSDSAVVAQNRTQIAEIDLLLADAGPLAAMGALVAGLSGGAGPERRLLEAAAEAMRAAQAAASHLASRRIVDEVTGGLEHVLRRVQAYRPEDLERMLADSRRRLASHRARMQSLAAAALDERRLATVRARLAEPYWTDLEIEPLAAGDSRNPVGLVITARRSEGKGEA